MNTGPISYIYMHGSRKFRQWESYSNIVFYLYYLVDVKGRERIQITLRVGHHQLTNETLFKLSFAGGLMMAQR